MAEAEVASRTRALHALFGILPLGAFVVAHLVVQGSALGGADTYTRVMSAIDRIPFAGVVLLVFVVLPFAFHGLMGLVLTVRAIRNRDGEKIAPITWLDRGASIAALLFVVFHLYRVGMRWLTQEDAAVVYSHVTESLSTTSKGVPWIALGYLVGVAVTVVHLGIGTIRYRRTRALDENPRASKRTMTAAMGACGFLLVLGTLTIMAFATGMRVFDAAKAPLGPCGSAMPASSSK